jgi:hypothetical protein
MGWKISPKVMLMPLAMPAMFFTIDMRPVYDGMSWESLPMCAIGLSGLDDAAIARLEH